MKSSISLVREKKNDEELSSSDMAGERLNNRLDGFGESLDYNKLADLIVEKMSAKNNLIVEKDNETPDKKNTSNKHSNKSSKGKSTKTKHTEDRAFRYWKRRRIKIKIE